MREPSEHSSKRASDASERTSEVDGIVNAGLQAEQSRCIQSANAAYSRIEVRPCRSVVGVLTAETRRLPPATGTCPTRKFLGGRCVCQFLCPSLA